LVLRGGRETRILSRNQNDLGKKFTEVRDSIAALDVEDLIIDGEIVALDEKGRSSFQLLQAFAMNQERPPIVFYVFDLLQLNGKDLRNLPIEERKAKLETAAEKAARGNPVFRFIYKGRRRASEPNPAIGTGRSDRQTSWI
jgi:bifunctional non-homologous end joining protein LigD